VKRSFAGRRKLTANQEAAAAKFIEGASASVRIVPAVVDTSAAVSETKRRPALLAQKIMNIRISVPDTSSIPFFAPNFWDHTEPWVARVRRNPLHSG
jgi:hypothetical protein